MRLLPLQVTARAPVAPSTAKTIAARTGVIAALPMLIAAPASTNACATALPRVLASRVALQPPPLPVPTSAPLLL